MEARGRSSLERGQMEDDVRRNWVDCHHETHMLRLVFLIATLISGSCISIKYYSSVDLMSFACTDITRSSFISRACYDKANQFMVVQLSLIYYSYCEMPAQAFEAFVAAPSMGSYYNGNIKSNGADGPNDCRTHRKPTY
jgi:hypothetical protein